MTYKLYLSFMVFIFAMLTNEFSICFIIVKYIHDKKKKEVESTEHV